MTEEKWREANDRDPEWRRKRERERKIDEGVRKADHSAAGLCGCCVSE